jgi:16S rRNA (guanine(966)-N(2))-methyltransferase RsmD
MYIIGGKFKKRKLLVPKTDAVRPTTSQLRECVFNICQLSVEGARFLDLFAGSGAMGLEALSRGAAEATFVDASRRSAETISKNIASLGVEQQTLVIVSEALKALERFAKHKKTFDLIYVDPPYAKGMSAPILAFLDSHSLLAKNGLIFIEEAHLQPPSLLHLHLISERKVGRTKLYVYSLEPPLA